jgi:hypothetical protein
MAARILVVTGASGAGKTTLVTALAARQLAGVTCAYFDSIGVPDVFPPDWQETSTHAWIDRLARDAAEIAVLDGQTRPTFALDAFARARVHGAIVLVECARLDRDARLVARGQPELGGPDMHAWSAYLRGQADALGLPVIDTSVLTLEQATDALADQVTRLR